MTSPATAPTQDQERPEPPFSSALVEELLKLFVKAQRAHQLYLQNNPMYQRSIELLRASFAPIWQKTDELVLVVTETGLTTGGTSPVCPEAAFAAAARIASMSAPRSAPSVAVPR